VECNVDKGWSIKVNETCRAAEYSQLDITNNPKDFFIGNVSLDGTPKEPPSYPECYFQNKPNGDLEYPQVIANLTFDKCGGFPFTADPVKDFSVYTGWINNRVNLSNVWVSEMDEIEVQCKFSDVDLNANAGIEKNQEEDIIKTLTSAELIDAFELKLQVQINGSHVTKAIPVGTRVSVDLLHSATNYLFQLKECYANATVGDIDQKVQLYTKENDYCPNPDLFPIIGLEYIKYGEYEVNVFRINNSDKLTFACKVTVFEPGSTKRINCPKNPPGRRRRNADDTATTIEIIETIDLTDEDTNIAGSGALQTSANIIVPSIFFMAFL